MLTHFYDIESTENVFTLANYMPEGPHCDLYYLVDDPNLTPDDPNQLVRELANKIYERNPNFRGTVSAFDLHLEGANRKLAREFGLSDAPIVNNPAANSNYPEEFRPVCDTDPDYSNEIHPYLLGFNSYNYDTTELALYFHEVWVQQPPARVGKCVFFSPTTAKQMRIYNDQLFTEKFKGNMPSRLLVRYEGLTNSGEQRWSKPDYRSQTNMIRKSMLMSGRHVDVARLNEKLGHVGLKRIIGMMGGQILESDKLKPGQTRIENKDQFYELCAYNVSDVVNLHKKVFSHKVYSGNFDLKKGLLSTYPELVYDRENSTTYTPVKDPKHVRRDRLFIDSSSAQLATKTLCPYDHLTDIPVVDFLYPAEEKARELGIPRLDILEETRKFIYSNFQQQHIRDEFDRIYNFYAQHVRGHNFNDSKNYASDYAGQSTPAPEESKSLPNVNMCMPYYNRDGTPSTCIVQFSIGGIHGAESNQELFRSDYDDYLLKLYLMDEVKKVYPDPLDLKKAKKVELICPDGEVRTFPEKFFLTAKSTMKEAFYREPPEPPQLFQFKNGSYKLADEYAWTSADKANHEDFKSYYPNLLRMMMAFWNKGLGYDRYAEVFDQKESLGKMMKSKTASESEKQLYAVQREGTKLLLNSASGAANATFESPIRLDNQIIKMRIIGQLFSYRIGQAQTLYGAKITSTNTDGLYSVMEEAQNNAILAQESANIGVEIEPEPMYLISKDTNNRIELDPKTGAILSASGGTLACQSWAGKKGPSPTKSLDHCAITDWALCEYLIFAATGDQTRASLTKPFNPEVGLKILLSASSKMSKVRMLNMFQNVIASSPGSQTYIFATKHERPDEPIVLQHYNRVFIMRDNTPNTVHLAAAVVRKLTPAQLNTRKKNNERSQQNDPIALQVLNGNGVETKSIELGYEASIKKVKDVGVKWFMRVENRDLDYIPEDELNAIVENLDYGKYLYLLAKVFDGGTMDENGKKSNSKGWRNCPPGAEPATDVRAFINDIDTEAAKLGIALPGRTLPQIPIEPETPEPDEPMDTTEPETADFEQDAAPATASTNDSASPQSDDDAMPNTGEDIQGNAAATAAPTDTEPEPIPKHVKHDEVPQQPAQPMPKTAPGANDLTRLLREKHEEEVANTKKQLSQKLGECVKLVEKLKAIPNHDLTPQYIAELQKALQTTIEHI